MRKLLATLALVSIVAAGASAQIMLGVTGALPMDSQMSAGQIRDAFQTGQNIWMGLNAEVAFGRLGLGGNFNFAPLPIDTGLGYSTQDIDFNGYLSYHLFKARAFLDPFAQLGAGYIGTDYASDSASQNVKSSSLTPDDPLSASLYWFASLGLGVNLGPVGVFGQMMYNNRINRPLQGTDTNGNTYDIPYYGPWNDATLKFDQYVPALKFLLGAKLILF